MTPVLTLTPLTRASKVLRALRNVCSYFHLKDPRRKRDVPPWCLGADKCPQCQWCNPQTQGALSLLLLLSLGTVEQNTDPLHSQLILWAAGIPWGRRLKSALKMSQNGPWKVLYLGNSPRGGSGSMQSGSPGLSLFSVFGTNWNVFRKVLGWCWSQPGPVPSPLAGRAHCSEFNDQGS